MDHHFPRPVTVTSSKDDDSKDTIGDDSYSTEGWCISNRGWLATVTFSTLGSHQVKIFDDAYKKEVTGIKKGGTITIELRAALNQDWNAKDYGWVEILSEKGSAMKVPVTESGVNTGIFNAGYKIPKDMNSRSIEVSYGYWGFRKSAKISIEQ